MKASVGHRAIFSPFTPIPPTRRSAKSVVVCVRRESGGRSYDGENARRSNKGSSYSNKNRRRGRAAWLRSPDDTPLRDGNRDRLMGLLTDRYVVYLLKYKSHRSMPKICQVFEQHLLLNFISLRRSILIFLFPSFFCSAARTLLTYCMELNPTLFGWLDNYLKTHEIPKIGTWDDVSGETFLRELLAAPIEQTSWGQSVKVNTLFDCTGSILVNPRDVAQRIMEIRTQIAKEMIEDLKQVSEENALLMRETVLSSFSLDNVTVAEGGEDGGYDPLGSVDDSAGGGDD